jgi:hypothetical protein
MQYFGSIGLLLITLACLSGCLPLSVEPLYTNKPKGEVDERLLGTWREAGANEQRDENMIGTWRVRRSDERTGQYEVIAVDDKQRKTRFIGTLVKVGDRYFLDLQNLTWDQIDANPWMLLTRAPTHAFIRVKFEDEGLAVASLGVPTGWDRFLDLLQEEPQHIEHEIIEEPAPDSAPRDVRRVPVLTADSKEIQAFVKHHLPDDPYFQHWHTMKRVAN